MNEPNNSVDKEKDYQPNFDEEAAEILRLKEACNRMAHEMLAQIDALLEKIDSILASVRAVENET